MYAKVKSAKNAKLKKDATNIMGNVVKSHVYDEAAFVESRRENGLSLMKVVRNYQKKINERERKRRECKERRRIYSAAAKALREVKERKPEMEIEFPTHL